MIEKGTGGTAPKKLWKSYLKKLEQQWTVMQRCVYQRQIHSVDELKRQIIDSWCGLEQSIFDEATDQWRGKIRACIRAKGGYFEYNLWTDNVDFVDICYIQCV